MKPEWGTKRTCQSCGAPFYDMRRTPIVCPKCGTTFDPEVFTKARRSRPQPVEEKRPAPVKKAPVPDELEEATAEAGEADEAEEFEDIEDEAGDEEDVIEDASELGEDEAEVGKVSGGKDED